MTRLDPGAAGVAYVTHWLRGRYGAAREEQGAGGGWRWSVEPAGTRRPFVISVEPVVLRSGLGGLRDRLEEIAEHILAHPPMQSQRYHMSPTGVDIRSD